MVEDKYIELEESYLESLCAILASPVFEGAPVDEAAETVVGMFHYVCVQHAAYETERFVDVVKNNGNMYKMKYPLYDEALVLYYCFKGEYEKAEVAFFNMRKDPMRNLACYYSCIRLLCAYGRGEFVNRVLNLAVVNKDIKNDDIKLYMFHIKFTWFLEDNYKKSPSSISASKLAKFNKLFKYGCDEDLVDSVQGTLFSNNKLFSEEVASLNNSCEFVDVLRFLFFRYMYDKGVDFLKTDIMFSTAFDLIHGAWSVLKIKNRKIASNIIFDFKYDDWIKALDRMPYDNMLEVGFCEVSAVWGSVYLYEFLYKEELLSSKQYNNFCKTIKKVKKYIMALYLPALWKFNFVHTWPKLDSVSDEQFDAEKIFFEKSIFLKSITPVDELKRVFCGEKNAEVLDIVKNIEVLEKEDSLFDKYCDQELARKRENGEYDFDYLLDAIEDMANELRSLDESELVD